MTKNSITLDVDPTIMEKNMRIVKVGTKNSKKKHPKFAYIANYYYLQETPVEGELKKLLSSVDTVPSRLVKPTPGKEIYNL